MASQPSRRMHTGIFSQESSLIISEESAVRMLCFTECPGIPTMKHVGTNEILLMYEVCRKEYQLVLQNAMKTTGKRLFIQLIN